jgi:hypothetical protein
MPKSYLTFPSVRAYKNRWNKKQSVEKLRLLKADLMNVLANEQFAGLEDAPKDLVLAIKKLARMMLEFKTQPTAP